MRDAAGGWTPQLLQIAPQRVEVVGRAAGIVDVALPLVGAIAVLAAAAGVVVAGRGRGTRVRAEAVYAKQVFARAPEVTGGDGGDGGDVRLSARPGSRSGRDRPAATDTGPAAGIARREAELYLEHHRIELSHHLAYQRAALGAGLLGFSVVLVSAVLTWFAGLDVGVVTALAGAVPSAAAGLLFQQAGVVGERASANLRALEDAVRRFEALQVALGAVAEIEDPAVRDRMHELIGTHVLFPTTGVEELRRAAELPADDRDRAQP